MSRYIDFSALKARVSMADILEHYDLLKNMKGKENQLIGQCPFEQHEKPSLSVNLDKNCWQCFGCKRHGNILDFVKYKEGLVDIKAAANWINDVIKEDQQGRGKSHKDSNTETREAVNKPLSFELKKLDQEHSYLTELFSQETISYFGLGFCSKGLMKGRVVIPIHDQNGDLVAYAGQHPDDQEGKYKFPPNFKKEEVLYNLSRQQKEDDHLILVKDIFSAILLHEAGEINAVALMDDFISDMQEKLLLQFLEQTGRVTIMFDCYDAGTSDIIDRLSYKTFIRLVDIPV